MPMCWRGGDEVFRQWIRRSQIQLLSLTPSSASCGDSCQSHLFIAPDKRGPSIISSLPSRAAIFGLGVVVRRWRKKKMRWMRRLRRVFDARLVTICGIVQVKPGNPTNDVQDSGFLVLAWVRSAMCPHQAPLVVRLDPGWLVLLTDRKSTRLNSSHANIS